MPIIALDLRPGNNLLDLCAGPGTKSILSLMTMSVDSITCNDVEQSRMQRVKRIMEEFTGSIGAINEDTILRFKRKSKNNFVHVFF